jgi:hypothetical protein
MLVMHSITNRNFEIHIFALLTFRRKFQDVTSAELLSPLLFEFRFRFGIVWGLLLGLVRPL